MMKVRIVRVALAAAIMWGTASQVHADIFWCCLTAWVQSHDACVSINCTGMTANECTPSGDGCVATGTCTGCNVQEVRP